MVHTSYKYAVNICYTFTYVSLCIYIVHCTYAEDLQIPVCSIFQKLTQIFPTRERERDLANFAKHKPQTLIVQKHLEKKWLAKISLLSGQTFQIFRQKIIILALNSMFVSSNFLKIVHVWQVFKIEYFVWKQ